MRSGLLASILIILMMSLALISGSPNQIIEIDSSNNSTAGRSSTSNLSWGPTSGLNVLVQPGTYISLSFNISNDANDTDSIDFTMSSSSGWDCNWKDTVIPCHEANSIETAAGTLAWPEFKIHVPAVVDGAPLAGLKHPFTLTATSSLDGAELDYEFTIELEEWHGATIDTEPTHLVMDPALKQRTSVTIRNIGNANAGMAARVVLLDANGQQANLPDLSFQHNGWLVGVFNVHLLNGNSLEGLTPNQSANVEVEIQPPAITEGEIRVGLIAWSGANPSQTEMVEITAEIDWRRGGELIVEDGCRNDVLPDESCSATISIENTGNFQDTYEIVVNSEPWLHSVLSRSQMVVPAGDTLESSTLELFVQGMVPAFTHGTAEIELRLQNGEVIGTANIDVRVAPLVNWELHAVETSTDSRDNVSVAFTLRNVGNGDDGLHVSLHVDMSVEHGLVPPDGAEHGATDGIPRYFEIDNIPPSVNFTFRSWMHIPRGMEANGTIVMTVDMQSTLRPEIVFTNITEAEFLAEAYRPENIVEPTAWDKAEVMAADIWNRYNGLIFTVVVTAVGSVFLYRAMLYRQRKDAEWKTKLRAQEPPEPEQPEEWMGKFAKSAVGAGSAVAGAVIEAPRLAAKVFTDIFVSKSPPPRPPTKPDPNLLAAANVVLEHHEKGVELDRMDDLAGELMTKNGTHPANESLPPTERHEGRTSRQPKRKPKPQSSQADSATPDVEGDEFDLDL